jgi:hypothetical protein
MQQSVTEKGPQISLESHLDIYRSLEQYVHDCGEAYPGETAIIQKNIRCLSKALLLSREPVSVPRSGR